jgi:hypothetical protein
VQALPPYAVVPVEFLFRALASHAGRLPLGGPRELVLATLMAARLAVATQGAHELPVATRKARAAAARGWFAALALPAPVRASLQRLVDATADEDRSLLSVAFNDVVAGAYPSLDVPARTELRRLSSQIATAAT